MTPVGVVANPRSWRNRDAAPAATEDGADVIHGRPDSAADYPRVLARFAEAGVGTVVVDGGDGTLRDVLSAMAPAYAGRALPSVALVPSGKTNVAAADVGGVPRGPDAVAQIIEAVRTGTARTVVRRPIAVTTGGRTSLGFVFGLGAFERATRLVNERVHSKGFAQGAGVALGVAMSAFAALGRDREAWRQGVPLGLAIAGEPAVERASFALLATSLHRLMLGLWPFWGTGPGVIALTEIAAPPQRLFRALATAGIGRPPAWAAQMGYRSVRTDDAELRLETSFIFDGDTFAPGADGRVTLSGGPELTFLRP